MSSSRSKLRPALGAKALFVWLLAWEDRNGRAIESRLAAVTVDGLTRSTDPNSMRRSVADVADRLAPAIDALNREWRETSAAAIRAFADARLARERAVLGEMGDVPCDRFQPGLFDRRAERVRHIVRRDAAELKRQLLDRLALVERMSLACCVPPVLRFAVLP